MLLPPAELLKQILEPGCLTGLGCGRQRFVERRVAATRAGNLGRRRRHLVAFPSSDPIIDEIDGELAVLEHLALASELVGVIPAVGVKRVGNERRSQRGLDLLPRQANLEAVDLILGNVVALIDVELVDAQAREVRAGAEYQGQRSCAKNRAHGNRAAAKR